MTATAGTPFSGVSVGDFASLYLDAGTVSVYVARVTAIGGGGLTLTLSATAVSGVAPTTAGIGISCTTGGAWKGPNAAEGFPFNFVAPAMTNAGGDTPRVNLKNNATYNITAAMTHAINGPVRFQGYTTTPGDLGKFTVDGGTSGVSYTLLSISGSNIDVVDYIFGNNGATSNIAGVSVGAAECFFQRGVVHDVRGHGLSFGSLNGVLSEHESYGCNQSNTANTAGVRLVTAVASLIERVTSHDNSGSNSSGFSVEVAATFKGCIADTNGAKGFRVSTSSGVAWAECDVYNNVSDGIDFQNTVMALFYAENCNLIKNGGYGINGSGAGGRTGAVVNCGFGAGTQANTSGTVTGLKSMVESGSVNYAADVTPWVDPANGDFRISLAAAKGTGRGTFTQTAASYAGTVGYPDIGAAQHLEAAAGGVAKFAGAGGGFAG